MCCLSFAVVEINSCQNLTKEGETYVLTGDIISPTIACIKIEVDKITLDCRGHTIIGNITPTLGPSGASGVVSRKNNYITIKNCDIQNFRDGISLSSTNYGHIINNTLTLNRREGLRFSFDSNHNLISSNIITHNYYTGIYFGGGQNNTFEYNEISYNKHHGIKLYSDSSNKNILVENRIIGNANDGIHLVASSNNFIDKNIILNNSKYDIYMFYTFGNSGNNDCTSIFQERGSSGNSVTCNLDVSGEKYPCFSSLIILFVFGLIISGKSVI